MTQIGQFMWSRNLISLVLRALLNLLLALALPRGHCAMWELFHPHLADGEVKAPAG